MGKPLNSKKNPCAIAASDCIVWTGKNICFIDHCASDSLTHIIEGLGFEICRLRDILNPAEYDIECLGFDCPPKSFKEIVQRLIEKSCENSCSSTSSTLTEDCCSQELVVPTCFQTETSVMTLLEYVQAIGNKVCEQQLLIDNQNVAIQNLLSRVTALENQVQSLIG